MYICMYMENYLFWAVGGRARRVERLLSVGLLPTPAALPSPQARRPLVWGGRPFDPRLHLRLGGFRHRPGGRALPWVRHAVSKPNQTKYVNR